MHHESRTLTTKTIQEKHRLLLFRLSHAINREQEIAGPLVMSYLMGWGDTYKSHNYQTLYWGSFVKELKTLEQNIGTIRSVLV